MTRNLPWRTTLTTVAGTAALALPLALGATPAAAQDWPSRPVRLIVR